MARSQRADSPVAVAPPLPRAVVLGWCALFTGTLIWLGDVFDALGYVIVIAVLALGWVRTALVVSRAQGARLAWALVAAGVHVAALAQLNRVEGFPETEAAPPSVAFWAFLSAAVLATLPRLYRQLRAVLVVAGIIVLPLVETPAFVTRQVAAAFLLVPGDAASGQHGSLLYVTQIGWDRLYAVARHPVPSGTPDYSTIVFTRHGARFARDHAVWLHDGGGTMDAQIPNLPVLLRWLLEVVPEPGLFTRLNRLVGPE